MNLLFLASVPATDPTFTIKWIYFFLFTLTLLANDVFAQLPDIEWQSSYGGSNNEHCRVIKQTSDLGYITAGFSNSNNGNLTQNYGNNDGWIVKLDSDGNMEWQKSFGGTGNDYFYDIIQTADGGYIACGTSYSTEISGHHGANDCWVVKLSASGTLEWQQVYGGQFMEKAEGILQCNDGSYVFVADSNSNNGQITGFHGGADYWVVKISNTGTILWQKAFGGTAADYPRSIISTYEGGMLVIGASTSINGDITENRGDYDYWIVKLSDTGIMEWQKTYGGAAADLANSAVQLSDGGFIISGTTYSNNGQVTENHGMNDIWVIRTDNLGNLQSQKCYGGSAMDYSHSLTPAGDGTFVIGGRTLSSDGDINSTHGDQDGWLFKMDTLGDLLWQTNVGGSGSDAIFSTALAEDGNIVAGGVSTSNNGSMMPNQGLSDFWVFKLNASTMSNSEFVPDRVLIFPNPVGAKLNLIMPNDFTADEVTICDNIGRKVQSSQDAKQIDVSHLPPGIYILRAISDTKTLTRKFIKQ